LLAVSLTTRPALNTPLVMGLNQSKSPPPVDLLPPRFDAPLFHPDPTPISPLQSSFGSRARASLLEQHYSLPGAKVSANLCPDKSIGALVSFDIPLTRASDGRPPAFDASVSGRGPLQALGGGYTGSGSLRMDGSGSLIAQGSVVESRGGYFGPEGASEGAISASSSSPSPSPSSPLSHLSSIQGMAPGLYARIPIQNHPSYPAPGDSSSGVGTLAPHDMGSRYTALSSPTSLPTLLPEVGVRYASATSSWAAGGHFGAGAHYPIKAWALGRYGGELVGTASSSSNSSSGNGVGGEEGVVGRRSRLLTFGVEVSGRLFDMFSTAPTAAATATAPVVNPFRMDPPPLGSPGRQRQQQLQYSSPSRSPPPLSLGAAVTLSHTQPLYELSLAVDSERGEAVAGYLHSLVVRRGRIWNPFEAPHVKGIYQYVDLGVECRRGLREPYSAAIGVGGAWQLNRNVLLKARVGSRDAAVSVALRSWTEPRVTLCFTASTPSSVSSNTTSFTGSGGVPVGFSLGGGALAWGVSVSLDQGTLMGSDFRLGDSREHKPVPSLQLPATPALNATR
jgi:hypothetical protein